MKLKVCGITRIEQVNALAEMQVDFIGFIGYEKSPRYVWEKIKPKKLSNLKTSKKVGVFVNEQIEVLLNIANAAELDIIQLHGNESIDEVKHIGANYQVIKAVSMGGSIAEIQSKIDLYHDYIDYFLFDTATKAYGGSGKKFNWSILNDLSFEKPYFLSGGLSPDMLFDFDSLHKKPFALDINSQFETKPGVKDLDLIQTFVHQVNSFNLK